MKLQVLAEIMIEILLIIYEAGMFLSVTQIPKS